MWTTSHSASQKLRPRSTRSRSLSASPISRATSTASFWAEMCLNPMKRIRCSDAAVTPVIVMCEVPSNAILAEEFLEIFDGMSIGSNDLTQLTLGLDRDSGIVNRVADENDPSV